MKGGNMEYRTLGKAGFEVSALGFGCGSVGGLLVRGEPKERVDAVARAIELGITYFDTAPLYGNGISENNLGIALKEIGADVRIGTKVELNVSDMENIEQAVSESVNASLKRLGKEYVDLVQLHNRIDLGSRKEGRWVGLEQLQSVIQAFQSLKAQGKVGACGITGLGDTAALLQAVDSKSLDTVQICYNLLNPSAGMCAPEGFPFQDYRQLIGCASKAQMGVIAIRILAAGALSGASDRHPTAQQSVAPIASSQDFHKDVERSKTYEFLVDEGYVGSMAEAAVRFTVSNPEISTALIGISSMEQLEQAVAYANKGRLPVEALDRLEKVWQPQEI
jgi:aryl-alcohol dehydrogenase-like predicted oxidoreductase